MSELSETVRDLRAKGYFLLPIRFKEKAPMPLEWQRATAPFPIPEGGNVGIRCGNGLGCLITNDNSATDWAFKQYGEPNVWSVRGGHWYWKTPPGTANEANKVTVVGEMEFHADRKQVVCPPSTHPTGAVYKWGKPLPPIDQLPEAPDFRELFHPGGEHHAKLLAMSTAAAHAGKHAEVIFAEIREWVDKHLPDPANHPDRELHQFADSADQKFYTPPVPTGVALFHEVRETIEKHSYLSQPWHYIVAALFVLQAHVAAGLPRVFYLFRPGNPGTGKSQFDQRIAELTNGVVLVDFSDAYLGRNTGNAKTLIIDEFDTRRSGDREEAIYAILRSGYQADAPMYCRSSKDGKNVEFDVFGPKMVSYRGTLRDTALQGRGFHLPAAKPKGPEGWMYVLRNTWPELTDLTARLQKWGADAMTAYPPDQLKAIAYSDEFKAKVEKAVPELGANRESEIAMVALLVAEMAGIDVATELRAASEVRAIAVADAEDSALEDLAAAIVSVLGLVQKALDAKVDTVRIKQKAVKDALNTARKSRGERTVGNAEFSKLRDALGIENEWLATLSGHALVWNVPVTFLARLSAVSSTSDTSDRSDSRQGEKSDLTDSTDSREEAIAEQLDTYGVSRTRDR